MTIIELLLLLFTAVFRVFLELPSKTDKPQVIVLPPEQPDGHPLDGLVALVWIGVLVATIWAFWGVF